jgi:hypothetical protein
MKNFRDELRLITNNAKWTDNEKFEAIDELHERYVAEKVKLFAIPDVSQLLLNAYKDGFKAAVDSLQGAYESVEKKTFNNCG